MKVRKSTIPKLQEQKQELEHDRNSPMLLYYYNAKWINIYEKKIRIEFPTKLWHAEIKSNEWERRENKLLFSIHLLYEYIRTTIKHTHKTLTFLCLTTTNTHTHTRIQTFSGHTKKKKTFRDEKSPLIKTFFAQYEPFGFKTHMKIYFCIFFLGERNGVLCMNHQHIANSKCYIDWKVERHCPFDVITSKNDNFSKKSRKCLIFFFAFKFWRIARCCQIEHFLFKLCFSLNAAALFPLRSSKKYFFISLPVVCTKLFQKA